MTNLTTELPRAPARVAVNAVLAAAFLLAAAVPAPIVLAAAPPATDRLPEVPDVRLFDLDLEMVRFLVRRVPARQEPRARVLALNDAIFGKKGLHITYDDRTTRTARETFESGSGNCLSFTVLFVAMARHLGLRAYFQEVDEVLSWDRRGEVILSNQHMFVEVEIQNGTMEIDFLPGAEKRYRRVRRVGDQRVLAHYYNNRGVETLATGDLDLARALFRKALEVDGTFSHAWTNLGVAQRRAGDAATAEASHRRAIELDSGNMGAVTNLAGLYLAQGRNREAEPLLARSDEHRRRNPFHHFSLGLRALRAGRPESAVLHFRDAIRRMPDEADLHAALADAYLLLDERENAVASLRKALDLADGEDQRRRLARRLESLDRAAPE